MTCLAIYLTEKNSRSGNSACSTYRHSLWKTRFNITRPGTGIWLKLSLPQTSIFSLYVAYLSFYSGHILTGKYQNLPWCHSNKYYESKEGRFPVHTLVTAGQWMLDLPDYLFEEEEAKYTLWPECALCHWSTPAEKFCGAQHTKPDPAWKRAFLWERLRNPGEKPARLLKRIKKTSWWADMTGQSLLPLRNVGHLESSLQEQTCMGGLRGQGKNCE